MDIYTKSSVSLSRALSLSVCLCLYVSVCVYVCVCAVRVITRAILQVYKFVCMHECARVHTSESVRGFLASAQAGKFKCVRV